MHICLQTKAIRACLVKTVTVGLCICTVLAAKLCKAPENSAIPLGKAETFKYLTQMMCKHEKPSSPVRNMLYSLRTEMNNDIHENSNNTPSEAQTELIPAEESAAVTEIPEAFNSSVGNSIRVNDVDKGVCSDMSLEDYVLGCVLAEMPSSFAPQALMAQSIAARTFSVRKILCPPDDKRHADAQICTDCTHCQSFISAGDYLAKGGNAAERLEKVRQAVNATSGMIAVFDGQPINAVYHASSGHETLSSKDVWGGDLAYLKSVPAAEDPAVCSETDEYTYDELSRRLTNHEGESVECAAQGEKSIFVTSDAYGSVEHITVSGREISRSELKRALSLRSADFTMTATESGVSVTSYGYGHRVGMSQYGADALADNGKSCFEILKYYYSGISFAYVY